jgi:hypothetical protein
MSFFFNLQIPQRVFYFKLYPPKKPFEQPQWLSVGVAFDKDSSTMEVLVQEFNGIVGQLTA